MRKALLLCLLATQLSAPLQAQTDTLITTAPDSVITEAVEVQNTTLPNKTRIWPVALAVAAILVSSYLLYNVRSR